MSENLDQSKVVFSPCAHPPTLKLGMHHPKTGGAAAPLSQTGGAEPIYMPQIPLKPLKNPLFSVNSLSFMSKTILFFTLLQKWGCGAPPLLKVGCGRTPRTPTWRAPADDGRSETRLEMDITGCCLARERTRVAGEGGTGDVSRQQAAVYLTASR